MTSGSSKISGSPLSNPAVDQTTHQEAVQGSALSKMICVVAWLALSILSLCFTGMIALGALAISSPWIFSVSIGIGVVVSCFALYQAIQCALSISQIDPAVEDSPRSSRTASEDNDDELEGGVNGSGNTSPSSQKSQDSEVGAPTTKTTNTGTPFRRTTPTAANNTPSSTTTNRTGKKEITKPPSLDKCMISYWSYDASGKTASRKEINGYTQSIREAQKARSDDLSFYEITKELYDVPGDQNCGFYSMAVLLVKNAIADSDFRERLKSKIQASFRFDNTITLFKKQYTPQDLVQLKNEVLKLIEMTGDSKHSLESILTYRNGLLFNAYFRALVIADFAALPEERQDALLIPSDLDPKHTATPLQDLAVNHVSAEASAIIALSDLLDAPVRIINVMPDYQDKQKTILDVSDIDNSHIENNHLGYLVFVIGKHARGGLADHGGHFLAAFPRN